MKKMVVALGLVALLLVTVAYVYAEGSGYGRMGSGYGRWFSLTSQQGKLLPDGREILTPNQLSQCEPGWGMGRGFSRARMMGYGPGTGCGYGRGSGYEMGAGYALCY